ncbi:primase alpha helix C-terminal domain-containing protein, partial [bacterium]|nr:primase alpha helix C-terminal domain-containing protein [bacterium]
QVKTITPGPKLVEGRRDNDLFLSACKLKDQGLDQATVEAMVKAEAKMCVPPFSEAEAMKKVRSAFSRPLVPMSFKM